MCYFVTLIAPTADADAVRVVLERHGRAATPIENPSVRKVLLAGEHQYLTTRGHCDCGTALIRWRDAPETLEKALAHREIRMQRRGWSENKIARALADRQRSKARKPAPDGPDSLELWNAILRNLGESLRLPYAGLLLRFYSGALEDEAFSASRRTIPRTVLQEESLGLIEADEVTIFPLN